MERNDHSPSEELTLSSKGYRLTTVLGEGSYAKVYLAQYRDENNKTNQLACKIVDTTIAPAEFVKKFLPRELEILSKINHPHLIHVHSIFQRKNKYYIFMRFAENGDLLEYILKKGAVQEDQARVWFRQMALGVQYLHDMEIGHRDLKCENILITQNYNLKLSDFGFARYVSDAFGKRLTSDTYCGSLSYAAPEILKGSPYYPKIADLWSLGIILYIMLNKAMPFDDRNAKRLHEQQINRRWKIRTKVVNLLSKQVKEMLRCLLEPEVTKRYKIDQVLTSQWFAMDPKLVQMTAAEQAALVHAQEERKRLMSGVPAAKGGGGTVNKSGQMASSTPAKRSESRGGGIMVLKDETHTGEDLQKLSPSMPSLVEQNT